MEHAIILTLKDTIAEGSCLNFILSGELIRDVSKFIYGMALNLQSSSVGLIIAYFSVLMVYLLILIFIILLLWVLCNNLVKMTAILNNLHFFSFFPGFFKGLCCFLKKAFCRGENDGAIDIVEPDIITSGFSTNSSIEMPTSIASNNPSFHNILTGTNCLKGLGFCIGAYACFKIWEYYFRKDNLAPEQDISSAASFSSDDDGSSSELNLEISQPSLYYYDTAFNNIGHNIMYNGSLIDNRQGTYEFIGEALLLVGFLVVDPSLLIECIVVEDVLLSATRLGIINCPFTNFSLDEEYSTTQIYNESLLFITQEIEV